MNDRAFAVLPEAAFRHSVAREADRAIRYQDFFSVCLLRPDAPEVGGASSEQLRLALSRKIAELLRSTDVVGHVQAGTAVLLLHTGSSEAQRVAERLRTRIQDVAFPSGTGRGHRITLSVGEASFPRDGSSAPALLARARAHLAEAARRGGNQVVRTPESPA